MCLQSFSYATLGTGYPSAHMRTGLTALGAGVEVSAQVLGFNFPLKLISV